VRQRKKRKLFNGKMHDEPLNDRKFFSLNHARQAVAAWMEDNNTARPHSSLDHQAPEAYAEKFAAAG
jgi:putative transposase